MSPSEKSTYNILVKTQLKEAGAGGDRELNAPQPRLL